MAAGTRLWAADFLLEASNAAMPVCPGARGSDVKEIASRRTRSSG